MSPAGGAAVDGRPPPDWWESGRLWLALAALSALPFLVSPFPMQPDWFSHVGRYHVMNHGAGDPHLALYYAFEWKLIGNLGLDLPMRLLGPLLGTELAAHLLTAIIPPLTVGGIYALSKAAGGRIGPGALAALPLLYAMPFTLGFLNFCFAQALALWAAAGWLKLADRVAPVRWAYAVPAAASVWLAHVAGWGILLILVGCLELARARRGAGLDLGGLFAAGMRALPFALPLAATFAWRTASADPLQAQGAVSFDLKLLWLTSLFRGEDQSVDYLTTGGIYALTVLLLGLLVFRRASAHAGLIGAGLILAALFLLLPQLLLGSYYADMRLLPAALLLLLIAILPRSRHVAAVVAIAGLALFAARIGVTAAGWHERGSALARDLAVLDRVPRGSRIAAMAVRSSCLRWTPSAFDHAPSLAIVRRHAFVNSQWDHAGSHLMRPIYNDGRGFNGVPSNLIAAGPRARCEGRPAAEILAALPRDRFDFVWMFDAAPPPGTDWLRPVATGPNGRLYRIEPAPRLYRRSPVAQQ